MSRYFSDYSGANQLCVLNTERWKRVVRLSSRPHLLWSFEHEEILSARFLRQIEVHSLRLWTLLLRVHRVSLDFLFWFVRIELHVFVIVVVLDV